MGILVEFFLTKSRESRSLFFGMVDYKPTENYVSKELYKAMMNKAKEALGKLSGL